MYFTCSDNDVVHPLRFHVLSLLMFLRVLTLIQEEKKV
jgi:hypothetical protein